MNIVDKCERCERKSFRPIEFGVSVSRASKHREVYEYILEIIVNTEYNTFQVKREINPFACADTWCNVVIVVVVVVAVVKITIDQVLQLKANLNLSYVHIAHVLRTSKHSHAHTEAKVTFLYCHTKGTHHYEFVLFSVLLFVCVFFHHFKQIHRIENFKKEKMMKISRVQIAMLVKLLNDCHNSSSYDRFMSNWNNATFKNTHDNLENWICTVWKFRARETILMTNIRRKQTHTHAHTSMEWQRDER